MNADIVVKCVKFTNLSTVNNDTMYICLCIKSINAHPRKKIKRSTFFEII